MMKLIKLKESYKDNKMEISAIRWWRWVWKFKWMYQ